MAALTGFRKFQKTLFTNNRTRRNLFSFIVMVAPALIWFLFIMGEPLLNMFRVSTLKWTMVLLPSTYIGLKNYVTLFTSDKFFIACRNTFVYWIVREIIILPISFILGFFLSQRRPGFRFFRTVFFIPSMLSTPALAMMFVGVFLPYGILNYLLTAVGLGSLTHVWFADSSVALVAMISVDIWGAIGWFSVVFFAFLSGLSKELIEAAQIDGANLWTVTWRIAFPLSQDIFGISFMLIFIGALTQVQLPLLLTNGGPSLATYTLGYYLYDAAFLSQKLGFSQAIGVFLFFVGILGVVLIRWVFHPRT